MEQGVREGPDINAVATRDATGVSVLVWHYHDDDTPGPNADITVSLSGAPSAKVRHYRMDAEHSNAFAVWQKMGAPQYIEGADYAKLEAAGQLERLDDTVTVEQRGGATKVRLTLPRQGVSLLRLEP